MLKEIKNIHFVGIGGYGMSGLARVLLHLGFSVSGSDVKRSEITDSLARQGGKIYDEHAAENVVGAELVVYSTAIPAGNPELAEARRRNLPLWHRSELLARFLNERYGIAVAGAHGKTTTTSMLALVLTYGGLDPTAFIGGVLDDFDGNARLGGSEFLVAEACESDHSFLRYRPSLAVVTNVEPDHLEHYGGDFNRLLAAYRDFLANIKPGGTAVLCADDRYLAGMRPTHLESVITYGLQTPADFQATDVQAEGWSSSFTVWHSGRQLGTIVLPVPGEHNVANALATVAAATSLAIPFDAIKGGLAAFGGAKRRFQFLTQRPVAVVDDYAHHPTEVQATLKAARAGHPGRVLAVFQPHRYNRTGLFMDEFARSFALADQVFLHKIYAAGEEPIPGVTSAELARRMRERGTDVIQVDDAPELISRVAASAKTGDLILVMGAGDITEIGHTIARRLQEDGVAC
ncbi:MAG: UDP-N-acetylmuramate--L-alanine ligase [Dethiobacter sp.]|nr:UDP-N-acetylmuramate--L-alanine ligase [Dethiobacter sp.]